MNCFQFFLIEEKKWEYLEISLRTKSLITPYNPHIPIPAITIDGIRQRLGYKTE